MILGSGTTDDYRANNTLCPEKCMAFNKPTKTKEPSSPEHAYNYAIFLLGLSMRTEYEMRRKMTLRGYDADVITQTIAKLYEEKLLDDRHYAEVYLNSLKEYRTFGFYGIKKKLLEKQLPKDYIEELLERELTFDDEIAIAQKFLAKQTSTDKQKLAQKLQARGFRMNVIAKLLF